MRAPSRYGRSSRSPSTNRCDTAEARDESKSTPSSGGTSSLAGLASHRFAATLAAYPRARRASRRANSRSSPLVRPKSAGTRRKPYNDRETPGSHAAADDRTVRSPCSGFHPERCRKDHREYRRQPIPRQPAPRSRRERMTNTSVCTDLTDALTTISGTQSMTVSRTHAALPGTWCPWSLSRRARTSKPNPSANFCQLSRHRLRSATIWYDRSVTPRTGVRT